MPASTPDATASARATPASPLTGRLVAAYEGLRPDTLDGLLSLYDEHASFQDPFNEVSGRDAIGRIFRHMFDALVEPRFVVTRAVSQGQDVFLTWDFHFRRSHGGAPMHIHGATHLSLAPDGRVLAHRDYWDAAQELYAKLPLLGALMRWLRDRLRTPQPG